MKKFIILLSLIFSTSIFAEGFIDVPWGAGYKEIKKAEKGHKLKKKEVVEKFGDYVWNETIYTTEKDLKSAGTFKVEYILLKDKLIKGRFSQKIKNGNLDNYNKIKSILFSKYGNNNGQFITSYYKTEGDKEYIQKKEVLSWDTEDTRIELVLINQDEFMINYYTLDDILIKFIEKTG
jgi:hypothetical protein